MVTAPAMAAIQYGNYTMTGDGMTVINGETVTLQKIKFLGKMVITKHENGHGLMPSRDGNNYGFEFVKVTEKVP